MTIEDGFAAAIGEEAIKQLQEVRDTSDDAFDRSGTMAPTGYYYHWGRLAPIGYHYVGGELLSDDGQLEWRQANVYERLQKLRDFVERNGGLVYDTTWPSQVRFGFPEPILNELIEANAKILSSPTGERIVAEILSSQNLEPIQIPASPSSAASMGQALMIDLVSIGDDELELITRLRTSAS
jgi:hypothetical protein